MPVNSLPNQVNSNTDLLKWLAFLLSLLIAVITVTTQFATLTAVTSANGKAIAEAAAESKTSFEKVNHQLSTIRDQQMVNTLEIQSIKDRLIKVEQKIDKGR